MPKGGTRERKREFFDLVFSALNLTPPPVRSSALLSLIFSVRTCVADFLFSIVDLALAISRRARTTFSSNRIGPDPGRRWAPLGAIVVASIFFNGTVMALSLPTMHFDALVNTSLVQVPGSLQNDDAKPVAPNFEMTLCGNVEKGAGYVPLSKCDPDTRLSLLRYLVFVTFSTVGYGDIVPATPFSRAALSVTQLMWSLLIAATFGIIVDRLVESTKSDYSKE